jgi:hypothetical protein
MDDRSRWIAELDAISASMDPSAPDAALVGILARRAVVIERLSDAIRHNGHDAAAEFAWQALLRARLAGERLLERLRACRATHRDHLGRLYHSAYLLRGLAAERRDSPRIECRA